MDTFNEKDKAMAEKIAKTLHNLQVQYMIDFNAEVQWLKELNTRFGEEEESREDPTSESDSIYFWDM